MRTLAICTISVGLVAGCSSYSPALHDAPAGKSVVYEMPADRAQRIILTVMSSHFAGRDVVPLSAPAIGYSTYTRFLADTWSTTVSITPVTARLNAREIQAVRIEASGSGTSLIAGRGAFEDFKQRLKSELDRTGQMREVESYAIN